MTREDEKKLLTDLMFANEQLAANLKELKKLDQLTQKISELEKIDTKAIVRQIQDLNAEELIDALYQKINHQIRSMGDRVAQAGRKVEGAGDKLLSSAKELNETSSNLMQLENIAKSIKKIEDFDKSYRQKSWYIGLAVAIFTGIFAGGALAYAKGATLENAALWLEFEAQNRATIVRDFESGGWQIQIPENKRHIIGEYAKNGKDTIIITPIGSKK